MKLALTLLQQLEEYYGRKITAVPLAAKVWIELLGSIPPEQSTKLVEKIITEEQWLPSVADVRTKILPALTGNDLEGELKQALDAYSRHDRKAQKAIAPEISEAIRAAGGVAKFMNASERQYPALLKKYSNCRATQLNPTRQLAPAKRSRTVIGGVA